MHDFYNITDYDLFCMVFDDNGQVKACGRDACMELMCRLKKAAGDPCGNPHTGLLELPEAYDTAKRYFL